MKLAAWRMESFFKNTFNALLITIRWIIIYFFKHIYPVIETSVTVLVQYCAMYPRISIQHSPSLFSLGVPYAEPPVRSFRFSPPRSPQPWRGVRQSQEFAPVCPQVLPNLGEDVKPGRYEYLERHLPYLRNQSEDCLYLNIYAPHRAEGKCE